MNVKKIVFYLLIPLSLIVVLAISYSLSVLINISQYPYIYDGFQEIMVFSNSPVVNDKSFQEATISGANDYGEQQYKLYGKDAVKIGQANPQEIDNFTQYQSLIDLMYDNGADILISAGYNVLDSMFGSPTTLDDGTYVRENNGKLFESKYGNDGKSADKLFVISDDDTHLSSINRNVISFRFESEYGGFLAGVSAGVYSTYISSTNNGVPNKVSAFGGLPLGPVHAWLSGYEQGINWFNYQVLGYDLNGNLVNEDAWLYGDSIYDQNPVVLSNGSLINDSINYQRPSGWSSIANQWYSGSFNIGEGTAISAKQIDDGSQVIFPVAAGQVSDALNQVDIANSSSNGGDVKVIGVDADASLSYPNNRDDILGSAIKSADTSSELGLWYSDRFINNYDFDSSKLENSYDQEMYQMMIHQPDGYNILTGKIDLDDNNNPISGWAEYNPNYTSRDFAQKSDQEIKDYFNENTDANNPYPNDGATYVENQDWEFYTNYGEEYKGPDGEVYSSEFVGNYQNGGISFVDSPSLDQAYSSLRAEAINNGTIEDDDSTTDISALYDYGISQNQVIESNSNTFADSSRNNPNVPKTSILTGDNQTWYRQAVKDGWMPDWNIYI